MDEEWTCEACTLLNPGGMHRCQVCYAQRPRTMPSLPNVSASHPIYTRCPEPQISGRIGWSTDVCPSNERRIVFLGRTGSGKSATGNNILGEKKFESSTCGSSVTTKCQRGTAVRFGRNIQIIDSPGLFDTKMTNGEITREVVKCVGMTAPGPHAFVLVVRIDRFTNEEQETVEHFIQVFGEGMLNYLVVLFTRKDDLIHDGKTLGDYIRNVPNELKQLLAACKNRCIAFNNRGDQHERDQDVQDFLSHVDRILLDNEGRYYTTEMYAEAEKSMKKREEQLMREHEHKLQQDRDNIRRECEQKLMQRNREHAGIADQLQLRIQELEQEKKKSETDKSEADVILLSTELKELRGTLADMKKEKEQEDLKTENERLRKENEALEELRNDQREVAREEVNKEKSGVMSFLGGMLPTLVSCVLPGIAGKAVGVVGTVVGKMFKK